MRDDPPVASFEDWYRIQWPRLVGWVTFSIGDQAQAEDIAADSFARALARWDKLSGQGEPTAWVYTVALNAVRKRWHRRAAENQALGRFEARTNPVGHEQQVPEPEIWTAVHQLPDRARTAIALRYVADLTEREVAEVMGISRGTVASTLSEARKRLANDLRAHQHSEQPDCEVKR